MKGHVEQQRECALDDAGVLRLMAERVQQTAIRGEWNSCATLAKSVSAYAANIAGRLEHARAFEAGAQAQQLQAVACEVTEPGHVPSERRRRERESRGMQPWEYRMPDGSWLTAAEIAAQTGASLQTVDNRIWRIGAVSAYQVSLRR